MPTDSEQCALVTERYPELADIDEQDNDRKLETYRKRAGILTTRA